MQNLSQLYLTGSGNAISNRLMSADVLAAAIVGVLALLIWEGLVRITNTSPYLLPVPLLILLTLVSDWCELFP